MSGIIKPKVINSVLLNNEINSDFITRYSAAPIYGKYGDKVFINSTNLPINFSINGKSNSTISLHLLNEIKLKYIIGEINSDLFIYLSKSFYEQPDPDNESLDSLIVNANDSLLKYNISSRVIAGNEYYSNSIIINMLKSLNKVPTNSNPTDTSYIIDYINFEIDKVQSRIDTISELTDNCFNIPIP